MFSDLLLEMEGIKRRILDLPKMYSVSLLQKQPAIIHTSLEVLSMVLESDS